MMAALAIGSAARASVVTYTLSLCDGGATIQQNRYSVYATVSPNDNDGLFAFGLDMKGTGAGEGGPTGFTLVNRTPNGKFDVDPSDPNYDPGNVYPTKYVGY